LSAQVSRNFCSISFDHPTIREISCTSAGKIFLFFALNLKAIFDNYFETNVTFLVVTSLFWLEGRRKMKRIEGKQKEVK